MPIRVSLDIGGVLSRYPLVWVPVARALAESSETELFVLTDMSYTAARSQLDANGLGPDIVPDDRLICANWNEHQEDCKAVVCRQHGIQMHVDDLPSCLTGDQTVGLLQMPRAQVPYRSPDWVIPEE